MLTLEASVGVEVSRNNAKQEVTVTRHEMAFNDLREPLNFSRKSIDGSRILAC
ncbi:hypothetical protein PMI14_01943 [Acidovorax sp. CF316]|nr:hypothetical protein PMI14_01943 [Acidovorax sp. CF316]